MRGKPSGHDGHDTTLGRLCTAASPPAKQDARRFKVCLAVHCRHLQFAPSKSPYQLTSRSGVAEIL